MWLKRADQQPVDAVQEPASSPLESLEPIQLLEEVVDPSTMYGGESGAELRIIFIAHTTSMPQPGHLLAIMQQKGYNPENFGEPIAKTTSYNLAGDTAYKTVWWVTENDS